MSRRQVDVAQVVQICPSTGKASYKSRAEAKRARRQLHFRAHVRAFACPYCPHWHLGTLPAVTLNGNGRPSQARRVMTP